VSTEAARQVVALDREVPKDPTAPGVPFPRLAEDARDLELESVASEAVRASSMAALWARVAAIVFALGMVYAVRHDLRFALAPNSPVELGANPTAAQLGSARDHLAAVDGIPGGVGAVDYRRPLSDGQHRLAPLVDRPEIYVDLRLPDGVEPTRFVPPTRVVGRLVPLDDAGVRYHNARALIESATGHPAPAQAWLLEQGAVPSLGAPGALLALGASAIAALLVAASLLERRRAR
jgi:hypothetical protein